MDMCVIVQRGRELDAGKVMEFIERKRKAKLAIVHSSLKDEVATLDFFEQLVRNLKVPFVGMRVSGTVTPKEGYCEDAVAIAILYGDFDVKVFHESIDSGDPEKTANKIIPQLEGWNLCLVYSANYFKETVKVDSILRRVQAAHPDLQMLGGVSAPPPIIATNEKVHKNSMVLVAVNGLGFEFGIDSGFKFDETMGDKFVITRADEHHIYEINGKNAVEEYSKIQHMRPYFINMLANLFPRPDAARVMKLVSKLNKVIYEGVLGMCIHVLGAKLDGNVAEILFAMELDEKKNCMVVQSYKPKGTVLRRLATSPEEQLLVYERLYQRFPNAEAMIINSCHCRLFWFDFDFEALEKKLRRVKYPFMVSYVYGGFGAYLPYKGPEQNVVHGGVVKALVFK